LRAVAAVVRRCRSLLSIVQGTDVHSATRPAAHDRVCEPAPAASAPRPSAAAGDHVLCSAALTAVLQGRQPGEASERQIWLNRAELTRRVVEVSQANPARFLAVRQLLGVLPLDVADVDAQLHAHIVSVKPSSGPSAPLSNATKARPDPSRFITPRPAPAAPASAALASTMGGAVGASVVARAAEAASASAAPMHAAAEQIVGRLDAAGLGSYTFKDLKHELGRRGFTVADLDKAELKRVVAVAIRRRHRALGECAAAPHSRRPATSAPGQREGCAAGMPPTAVRTPPAEHAQVHLLAQCAQRCDSARSIEAHAPSHKPHRRPAIIRSCAGSDAMRMPIVAPRPAPCLRRLTTPACSAQACCRRSRSSRRCSRRYLRR
jgi:hypothetical protein